MTTPSETIYDHDLLQWRGTTREYLDATNTTLDDIIKCAMSMTNALAKLEVGSNDAASKDVIAALVSGEKMMYNLRIRVKHIRAEHSTERLARRIRAIHKEDDKHKKKD